MAGKSEPPRLCPAEVLNLNLPGMRLAVALVTTERISSARLAMESLSSLYNIDWACSDSLPDRK